MSVRLASWISALSILIVVLLAGCTSHAHTSVSDALSGRLGDRVELEQVRVWDVQHTEQELRFTIFDHRSGQEVDKLIQVVTERNGTRFIPEKWDWVKVEGTLIDDPEPGANMTRVIQAHGIFRSIAGWGVAD